MSARHHGEPAAADRLRKFASLGRLTRLMTSAVDPARVFTAVSEAAVTLLVATTARVWVADHARRVLKSEGSFGIDPDIERAMTEFPVIPFGQGVVGRIIETRTTEVIPDIGADPRWLNKRLARDGGLRTFVGVPLIEDGGVLGVLAVLFVERRTVSADDEDLIHLLADHAVIAIQNATLYADAERRRRAAESLAALGRHISRSLDPGDVARRIVDSVRGLLHPRSAVLCRLDADSGELRVLAASGESGLGVGDDRQLAARLGVSGLAVREERAIVVPDTAADPRISYPPDLLARMGDDRAVLSVPLRVDMRVTGALSIRDVVGRVFTAEEIDLVSTFAAQAAVALENAELFARTERAVAELSRTQEQLTQSQKMEALGKLVAGVAHDFRNLLTIIQGRSSLLRGRVPPDSQAARDVALIEKAAERAAVLIRQLLGFARRQVLEPVSLCLNTVVHEISGMLGELLAESIEMELRLAEDLWQVLADPAHLQQILLNLAVNARDAMPQGGRLIFETANVDLDSAFVQSHPGARPGPHVMLAVHDTGIGMDKATRLRAFEPFFTTKAPGKGTGLGLAMLYGIVKQSDGYVAVESEVGRGTTFQIYLPRTEESPPAPTVAPEEGAVPFTNTVLIVDDEADIRALVRDVLTEQGYHVVEAASGAEALRVCLDPDLAVDILITDIFMPGMDGIELAQRVSALGRRLRVLFMSAHSDTGDVTKGRRSLRQIGGPLLAKPFTIAALVAKVQETLSDPRRV